MVNNVINFSEFRASCSKCNLYELCVPRGLNKVDIEKLNHVVRNTKNFDKGEYLFREGDVFTSFYAVKSGSIKLFIINEKGDEQIVGFYFPGEILGFDALENERHTCYAVALESASFCSIPYEKLNQICLELPELQKQMFRLMGREFSNENKMLLNINNNSAEQRIVIFLLSLSKRFQKLGYSAKSFNLTMSRNEIGNYLGLQTETVSRLLTKLKKDGLIKTNRREIIINNLPLLQSMSESNNKIS